MKKLNMTNMQRAYLLGRQSMFELGGCSTHVYYEFINDLDIALFYEALNAVIGMQEVMRTVIYSEGYQVVLEDVPEYREDVLDWRDYSDEELKKAVEEIRDRMSHEVIECGKWPMYQFVFALLPNGKKKLFVSYDLIVSDALSFVILCSEMEQYYKNHNLQPLKTTYQMYLKSLENNQKSKRYLKDKNYWLAKLDKIAPAPELPYLQGASGDEKFGRRHYFVKEETWTTTKTFFKQQGISPTVGVLSVYAKVISFWTNQENFTVNLPMSSSIRRSKGMDRVMGDFTESLILSIPSVKKDFIEYMSILNKQFFNAYKHRSYDGIELMGEIRKQTGDNIMFPVVFTGMISESMTFEALDFFGNMVYGISQTPQVKLDCQVFETGGQLKVVWDYKKKYFAPEEIDEMFEQFISALCNIEGYVLEIPKRQKILLEKYNDTYVISDEDTISGIVTRGLAQEVFGCALKDDSQEITSVQLKKYVNKMANYLIRHGIKKNVRVGVLGERNVYTVIAIYAIERIGAVYVPINPQYPQERRDYILKKSKCVLCVETDTVKQAIQLERESLEYGENVTNGDAYVIYTSGSTGQPKGVVIPQKAAANTVHDMNDRFEVRRQDVFLNVAAFGFDLSVYDLFGAMAAQAKLVIEKEPKNIEHIIETLKKESVTIWNSVPAMMGLAVDLMEDYETVDSLRLILLSGDWIPVDLPDKIRSHFPNANIVSLGGATEASIWSVLYPVKKSMSGKSSVPYGYPMRNQKLYILDENQEQRPFEVEGEIYIGGQGVARCYDGEKEKTEQAFIEHKTLGRLYKTGDFGKMKREGFMEFRGRRDSQVKIHGYRVELGEIENAILQMQGVKNAVLQKYKNELSGDELLAYVVTEKIEQSSKVEAVFEDCIVEEKQKWNRKLKELEQMHSYMKELDKIAMYYMQKVFCEDGDIECLSGWMEEHSIDPKYTRLLSSWLSALEEHHYIQVSEEGRITWLEKLTIEEEQLEAYLYSFEGAKQVSEITKYFINCCKNHWQLLREEISPVELLFGDAKYDVADNIYRTNRMSEMMNLLLGKIVYRFVSGKKVKILELGAGTGSTARFVLDQVKNEDVEYTFTDISEFFLDKAKEQFPYSFMNYRMVDINENMQVQGCEYGEYDVIIAANVMHDAEILQNSLKNVQEILKKDGWLFLLETTKNTYVQRTSFGFLEGLTNCKDFRKDGNGSMIRTEQWKNVLLEAGFRNVSSAIEDEEYNGYLWQNILMAQNGYGHTDLKSEIILEQLRESFPDYMIPSRIYRIENIPLSANQKVDKKALYTPKTSYIRKVYEKPKTEMERRLAELWEKHLGIDKVGVTDSFFELGGDSLKAIMLVTMAKKAGIGFELADLYQYNNIRKLAKKVQIIENVGIEETNDMGIEDISEDDMALILDVLE